MAKLVLEGVPGMFSAVQLLSRASCMNKFRLKRQKSSYTPRRFVLEDWTSAGRRSTRTLGNDYHQADLAHDVRPWRIRVTPFLRVTTTSP